MWMFLAQKLAELGSNCKRRQTGAVIVRYSVYVTGAWNRIADDRACQNCPREGKQAGRWTGAECGVEHAEAMAIRKARELQINITGATMYSTYKPCLPCARAIVDAGIAKVVYQDEYPGGEDVQDYLAKNGVQLVWEG